ncbi:unnamed protein product [Phytomonas sp. EM1]|nr:unnamed protein product [Phytomonas sp. EM1]|eukprot:CCW60766.1 unnamed protein product [Phytomonas sp. isolate EM1]
MAVVEVGTWNVRAGYIGDLVCTRQLRSLCSCVAPEETDFISMIKASSGVLNGTFGEGVCGAHPEKGSSGETPIKPLWTLDAFERDGALHVDSLRRLKCDHLHCPLDDPLLLVLPERWHEERGVMQGLFEAILEAPHLTRLLYAGRPSVGWAFAAARASAVVLDVGHFHSTVAAVLDGYVLRGTIDTAAVGGAAVSAGLSATLQRPLWPSLGQRYAHLLGALELKGEARGGCDTLWDLLLDHTVADIKRLCGVVRHPQGAPPGAMSVRAPDGTLLELLPEQRWEPFEVLFGPEEGGTGNVARLLFSCMQQLDPEWRLQTVHHVLGGGGSLVPGFRERILHETKSMDPSYYRYERDNAFTVASSVEGAWAGNSIAAASSSFESLWISKSEWDEEGESCLFRKLFY